jgi:hypothetical protein
MQGWNRISSLRVSPYFQVLALFKLFPFSYFHDPAIFKSFPKKVYHILLIQVLQAIKLKNHNNHINQVEFMSYYVMTDTNKRYLYPRVTAIRINVHPTGENSINTLHAFHARFTYGHRPYISRGPHRQPFAGPHEDKTCPYTWKKSWRPKTGWLGRHLGSPHSSSLTTALE